MALLNYSVPFLNVPTPAPFYVPPNHPQTNPPNFIYPQQQDVTNPFNPGHNTNNPNNHPYNGQLPYQQNQQNVKNVSPSNYNGNNKNYVPQIPSQSVYTPNYQYQNDNVQRYSTPSRQESSDPSGDVSRQRSDTVTDREQRNAQINLANIQQYPTRPIEYKRIDPDSQKTSIHPIIDYDNDYEYYDDDTGQPVAPKTLYSQVAPIQGPIYLKNGTVPVVPLYSYPVLNNGSFIQIPILWTALSVALGLELRGEIIRGVPCIKRYHQLFCPTAGNNYPIERIEMFIDENKALMKRMYGDFSMSPNVNRKKKRSTSQNDTTTIRPGVPDMHSDPGPDPLHTYDGDSYFAKLRKSRQQASTASSSSNPPFRNNQSNESGRMDVCESKVEIVTPYWASNSAGKIRAIVNTQHFEQAIHQEVCSKMRTNRCSGDCGCEQKYKWHRLLAYDPDNDCKGIFMDWFLFPSCCVCRCSP